MKRFKELTVKDYLEAVNEGKLMHVDEACALLDEFMNENCECEGDSLTSFQDYKFNEKDMKQFKIDKGLIENEVVDDSKSIKTKRIKDYPESTLNDNDLISIRADGVVTAPFVSSILQRLDVLEETLLEHGIEN